MRFGWGKKILNNREDVKESNSAFSRRVQRGLRSSAELPQAPGQAYEAAVPRSGSLSNTKSISRPTDTTSIAKEERK